MDNTTLFFCVPDYQGSFFLYLSRLALTDVLDGVILTQPERLAPDAQGWVHGFASRAGAVEHGRAQFAEGRQFTLLRIMVKRSFREQLAWQGKLVGASDPAQSLRVSVDGWRDIIAAAAAGQADVVLDSGMLMGSRAAERAQETFFGAGPTGLGGC